MSWFKNWFKTKIYAVKIYSPGGKMIDSFDAAGYHANLNFTKFLKVDGGYIRVSKGTACTWEDKWVDK